MARHPMFRFEPIPAPTFDLQGVTLRLRKALEEEARQDRRLLDKTTQKWAGTRPQFRSQITIHGTALQIETLPFGEGKGAKKWWWLEAGTRIRWAVMSKPFRAKTRRAWLNSRTGRGGPVIVGRRAMRARGIAPRPGIPARNWRAEVVRLRFRALKGLLQREFDLIARNTIRPATIRLHRRP